MSGFDKWWKNNRSAQQQNKAIAREVWDAAVKAERNACAKLCEQIGGDMHAEEYGEGKPRFWPDQVSHRCATKIMERSNVGDNPPQPRRTCGSEKDRTLRSG